MAGRYRIGELLGRGGMAEVYRCHDERLDRPVALKVLRAELAEDVSLRLRFEVEARMAARLSNPNVVAVYDVGEERGRPYIVMELLPAHTLADVIRAGPLSEADAIRLATEVLHALSAAHDAGLLHRDIKPSNILITAGGSAKVADFGIAKAIEEGSLEGDLTSTNLILGTPFYLAPERAQGRSAGIASELWAVGVVLYEMLAGRRPFNGATPLAVALQAQRGQPEPLGELRPGLSPQLLAIVDRALKPQPMERFGSASEMAAALTEITDPNTPTALRPSGLLLAKKPPLGAGASGVLHATEPLGMADLHSQELALTEGLKPVHEESLTTEGLKPVHEESLPTEAMAVTQSALLQAGASVEPALVGACRFPSWRKAWVGAAAVVVMAIAAFGMLNWVSGGPTRRMVVVSHPTRTSSVRSPTTTTTTTMPEHSASSLDVGSPGTETSAVRSSPTPLTTTTTTTTTPSGTTPRRPAAPATTAPPLAIPGPSPANPARALPPSTTPGPSPSNGPGPG